MSSEHLAASGGRRAPIWVVATLLCLIGGVEWGWSAPAPRVLLEPASAQRVREHSFFLGSDALAGRGVGTPGCREAASYIAAQLAQAGARPLLPDGSLFQPVPLHGSVPLPDSDTFLISGCGAGPLQLDRDVLLFTSGLQTYLPQPVPLVFVGYGIVAPEFDYNDYQGVDVAGKVVVFLSGEPYSEDRRFFDGERRTVYSTPEAKQRIAISRGARGSILIPSANEPAWKDWSYWREQFAFEHVTLAYAVPKHFSALLSSQAAARLFCDPASSLEAVYEMERRHTMRSFPLGAAVRFRGSFRERDFLSRNVVAALPGSDPRLSQTSVLVLAHYDHLGTGPPVGDDAIYNGVVDNALGVAGLLELARLIGALPERPGRTLVFLATTAEEKGLLGASYYVDHPAFPLHRTVAAVNVDGLAHFDTFRSVVGVGGALSSLGDVLERVAAERRLGLEDVPTSTALTDPYAFSDQAALADAGVPAILIHEGLDWDHHTRNQALARAVHWGRSVYHTPFDDVSQPLDFDAARQHVELLLAFIVDVANDPRSPRWHPGSPYALAQLRLQAEGR